MSPIPTRKPGQPELGRLQVWLGYSAGIGKTYTMLSVAHRLRDRGEDVVVGFVETHGRAPIQRLLRGLDVVPRAALGHRGAEFEEMDIDAVLVRRPAWAVVDELAHTNVPGSRNDKRWQDVEELLAAGISVLTTVNIQHLESLNDTVERITGVKQREIVPDSVVRAADQIDLVDVAPDALRRRLARGDIYPAEKVDAALSNYFREGNLTALRELALLWLADRVDEELLDYMDRYEIGTTWETRERIVVAVSGRASDLHLIRRAARMAARRGGEFLTVHVVAGSIRDDRTGAVGELATLTRDLGGTYHEIAGGEDVADVAEALVEFSRTENATQLVLGASSRSRWRELIQGSLIPKVIRASGPIDVHVISQEGPSGETPIPRRSRHLLPARRQRAGFLIAALGLLLVTILLSSIRTSISLPTVLLVYLSLVVAVAAVGGWWPALLCAIGASLLANYYFTPPLYRWTIAEPENILALIVFLVVAAVVSSLVSLESRNRIEAARGRAEADALSSLARSLSEELDPLPSLVRHLQGSFGLESVAVLRRSGDGWRIEASAGPSPPEAPTEATLVSAIGDDAVLVARGTHLPAEDQRLVAAFIAQLTVALRNRRLAAEAASATQLASINELRSAILNAVSHDLRTPLASIKAAVSSLRQDDVQWSEEEEKEFLATIEDESDRLNWLVGNLLDMSRLQAGAFALSLQTLGVDEVVLQALHSLPVGKERVVVDIPETLSPVTVDPGLLERAVANVVDNALSWNPPTKAVRVQASEAAGEVQLRVIDQGPGIPEEYRATVFEPFQRFGDRPREGGVGLGLAVAQGLVEAMGGTIALEDTPGGGLTVVFAFEAAP